jgi:UPF0176 protein
MNFIHIAGYKFIPLDNLPALRAQLKAATHELSLLGTILLSPEGINVMLAGSPEAIHAIRTQLIDRFSGMRFRETACEIQPFQKMVVKLKKEIISMGAPGLLMEQAPPPRVTAQELKQWLDEKRDVVLLDTRNAYEIEAGTFENAVDPHINYFRNFPDAIAKLDPALKEKTVVTFCTGGIRCEKAGLALQQQGFKNVYQLDGGILRYFDECGQAHYQGKCFVFDERIME